MTKRAKPRTKNINIVSMADLLSGQQLTQHPICSGQKPSGIRPNPKAVVSAMPVVSVKAKARIAAIFMANHPSSAMTMLQEQEKSCALSHNRDWGRGGIIPGPPYQPHTPIGSASRTSSFPGPLVAARDHSHRLGR